MKKFFKSEECEKNTERGIQLQKNTLSPIDYKTQALITIFFGALGISDFYAGNHSQGLVKLAASIFITPFVLGSSIPIIWLISIIQLSNGQYTDGDGKIIRQVVPLKKEEMSSCDRKTALLLSIFLGVVGAHQFYAGKPLKGVMMICSLGGLGIWWMVNTYQLLTCGFKDGTGKVICPDYIKLSAQN